MSTYFVLVDTILSRRFSSEKVARLDAHFALAWLQEHDVVDVFGVEGAGPERLRIDNRTLREVDEAEAIHIAQTMLNQAMAMGAVRAFQQQNCSNWDNCFSVSLRHRSFFRTSTSQVLLQVRTLGHGIRS